MRLLGFCFPAALLFSTCPLRAAAASALPGPESTLIASARETGEEQLNSGLMYLQRGGAAQDRTEAAQWFRKAVGSNRSLRIRLILLVLVLLILAPFVIAVILLMISRDPPHRSLPAAGIPEHLEQAGSPPRDSDIIAELENLRSQRTRWTGWASALLVLMISVALFIAIRAGTSAWELLITIAGILFLHEAGHYLAMRVFHYRNVRTFFTPFFGAAVSGQNYTAPGWKKVTVAFMGPLPGILLGSVLGLAGFIRGSEWMAKVAMTAVLLNGFQLLPVLPLDGGRVMHALLFGRNHWLAAVLRVLAAGAVAGIGFLSGDRISLFLGLFLLAGVSSEYKTARIAAELRRQGIDGRMLAVSPGSESATSLPAMSQPAPRPVLQSAGLSLMAPPTATEMPAPVPAEDDWIPQTVAGRIVERVKARFPQVTSPRQVARLTLHVYERLASRPPGIWASIGFACLHYALFIIALVSMLLVILTGGVKAGSTARGPEDAVTRDAVTISVELESEIRAIQAIREETGHGPAAPGQGQAGNAKRPSETFALTRWPDAL